MYALADRFPGLLTTLPRRALANLPTPVEEASELGRQAGIHRLLVKRDDLTANLYGGNKVRKLEFLLADAQLHDCDTVLTFGATGSNHALATSIFARELGLKCIAVLTDQAWTPNVGRTLRYHARLGTQVVHAKDYRSSKETSDEIASTHPAGPEHVYRIPWGGSSWLGTVGFVNAALELVEQMGAELPDVIYVACGTMGTAVGLGLGLSLAGVKTRVEAVQVVPNVVTNRERLQSMHEQTNEQLAALDDRVPVIADPWERVSFRTEYLGTGYAETTPECVEAVQQIGDLEGLQLETTYTGKALAALIGDAKAGKLAGQKVMFWNTYNSQPAPDDLDKVSVETIPESLRHYLQ